ncbi:hypothetical protein LELG_04619 [Lodderomyces elongisporus NRRL YB-4239]|uniref:Dolichyl-phosphate-mannose--protein mannosyltransferase n=1 Tax=Lodderomyces elongisporus (strain ATCC 11503 / CBS 2605 / JCM 1781 / NBRC 1676 / NRRL YB-4239) TaxID=379508 RepID=A5E4T0_LODEL|nr:hypothetical protein LELG_04619 [Lodderomyces elongisporus NRRL YB-4239]
MSDSYTSSSLSHKQAGILKHRTEAVGNSRIDEYSSTDKIDTNSTLDMEELIHKTSQLKLAEQRSRSRSKMWEIASPLILTAISAFVRIYRIDMANKVIWDEAHFGKFASQYLKQEHYFDVHPPMGKLLLGLAGYLAEYDGSFEFKSGQVYPDSVNFVVMRLFSCIFGVLTTPLAYQTSLRMGYSQQACWLISLMVTFEQMSLTLSRFILLDSILLFFAAFTFFGLLNLHKVVVANRDLTKEGLKWFTLTGLLIGCVCSVKWVGLFITSVVGLYTAIDLLLKTLRQMSSSRQSHLKYLGHWIVRVATLIMLPMLIYMAAFKVHFTVLKYAGDATGSTSTLLQASFVNSDLLSGPRSVSFESMVTIRSLGLSPNLLHSHEHNYPMGSQEQQITAYAFKDANNQFVIKHPLHELHHSITNTTLIENFDTFRIMHNKTGCYLRSQPINAALSDHDFEVSCTYEDETENKEEQEWVLEIQGQEKSPIPQFQNESEMELHPISTSFRLRNKHLGCYLASTGREYPPWGFRQGEVVCKYSLFSKDKTTWWNVEDHQNSALSLPAIPYVPPKPKFWKEFVLLNYGMMISNSALLPDPDRFDRLSSEWWEWPILRTGLRMSGWGENDFKCFLIGNPLITWSSSCALVISVLILAKILFGYQRQQQQQQQQQRNEEYLIPCLILPLAAWIFNLLPFLFMGRVKYLHHYMPAQYFAIFVTGFVVDRMLSSNKIPSFIRNLVYVVIYILIAVTFWKLKDLAYGMVGSPKNFRHLRLLSTWMI